MNDSELITAVRESVTGVHTATPVEQLVSRGRALRARRRLPGVAGALAAAVGGGDASPQLPPSARISPIVAWYCAARTCTATRRLASSLRRASSSSSWLTMPLR